MQPPPADYKTKREAMERLTKVAPCNACHTTKVNPPGFVLERYNAIGAWQDTDPLTGPINSTADVIFTTVPEVKKTITSPSELMAEIAKTPNAQRAYAQSFLVVCNGPGRRTPWTPAPSTSSPPTWPRRRTRLPP